ncbi:DUF4238 domain-containing protein [Brevundimonas aurantiaca]|uniref:DUF4238 domain-containing protein n=1 Tax=Brevundimonas aurantiaca TaxID=74316 RepID=UPI001917EB6A|nr:DUF4238 domain-containing protein [Brevundimonas aurantiaca]
MTQRSYRHNHYVPEWYQRRFLAPDQHELHYLDLKPEPFSVNGRTIKPPSYWRRGVKYCFAQDDLYTTTFNGIVNTEIEQFFFGDIDNNAPKAFDFWSRYDHSNLDHAAFSIFLTYISLQRLRTPRGLAWLRRILGSMPRSRTLIELQRLQRLFCATWSDAVWQIVDAAASPTKFIISDNPVTFYNRDCFPNAKSCRYPFDPDVRQAGTQTIFPISPEKLLIFTNLTWARNPYQSATKMGPNPKLLRNTVFYYLNIQVGRQLSEEEVLEINFIIKRRADRYIAAAEKEWLYPERRVRCDHWRRLGDGYLLMPDPRHVRMGGEITVGYDGGGYDHFSEYGHKPWEPGYKDARREQREGDALRRFQAEWSAMYGPDYRGLTEGFGRKKDNTSVPANIHASYLKEDEAYRAKPGERARRRLLRRP